MRRLWAKLVILAPVVALGAEILDIGEVVVTATKTPERVEDVSFSASVITPDEIEMSNAVVSTELLSTLPSLVVKKMSNLGRADIEIRGLGQRGRRVGILLDGRPLKMGLFGCGITHMLTLDNVERVEVIRGPASPLWGSDALGGTINILTRSARKEREFELISSFGSFSTLRSTVRAGGIFDERINLLATADFVRSNGTTRQDEYEARNFTLKAVGRIAPHATLTFLAKVFRGKKWSPGPEGGPTPPDLPNDYMRGTLDLALRGSKGGDTYWVRLWRDFGHHRLMDGWHSKDYVLGLSTGMTIMRERSVTTVGLDYRWQGGRRLPTDEPYASVVNRPYKGPEKKVHKHEWALYFLTAQDMGPRARAFMGVRLNRDSAYGSILSPKLGLVARLRGGARVKFNLSHGFRSPQPSHLYLLPPANPDLKPEKAWNIEVSLLKEFEGGLLGELTIYSLKARDLIGFDPQTKKFQNIGSLRSRGLEIGVGGSLPDGSRLTLYLTRASFSPMPKEGRYKTKADLVWMKSARGFELFVNAQYFGSYKFFDGKGKKWRSLNPYLLVNLKVAREVGKGLHAFLAVDNLLNFGYKVYVSLPGAYGGIYRMPGRSVAFGLRWAL